MSTITFTATEARSLVTSHERAEHTPLVEAYNNNDWTQAERIAARETCAVCRLIFRPDGEFRAAGNRGEALEFTTSPAGYTARPAASSGYHRPTRVVYPASDAQVRFLTSLWNERDTSDLTDSVLEAAKADKTAASNLITLLKDRPRKQVAQTASAEVTEDGMYQSPEDGTVWKVQIAKQGSGRLYAKRLVLDEGDSVMGADGNQRIVATASFEYAAGAIRNIRPEWKMTREQAAEFGALYGVCCQCGAALTDEASIARGIGPICAEKF